MPIFNAAPAAQIRQNYGPTLTTVADLRAVTASERFSNQLVFVNGVDATYEFEPASVAVDDGDLILEPDDSPATGRWEKRGAGISAPAAHAPTHVPQTGTDPSATAAAGSILIGDSSAVGTADSVARSDHKHALAVPAAPADTTKAAAAAGVATEPSRADHKHDVDTAAAATIGTANAEGAATSLARSDHGHDHGAQITGTHHATVIAAGANGFMTGADKTKLDAIAAGADVTGANAPQAHAASHQNAGGDEISVIGLSGLLADNQNPTAHASEHTDGTDDIQSATASVKGLATAAQITKLDGLNPQTTSIVSTTDATVTTIATIPITDDSVNLLEAHCVARRTDVDEAAIYIRKVAVFRRAAGAATLLGAEDNTLTREDDNQWDFNIVVSGNNALLQVTGRAARNIDWKSFHEMRTIT